MDHKRNGMTPERLAEIRRAMAVAAKVINGPTIASELLEEVDRLLARIAELESRRPVACGRPCPRCGCSVICEECGYPNGPEQRP